MPLNLTLPLFSPPVTSTARAQRSTAHALGCLSSMPNSRRSLTLTCPAQASACTAGPRPHELLAIVPCALVTPLRRWQLGNVSFAWSGSVYAHPHTNASRRCDIAGSKSLLTLVRFGSDSKYGTRVDGAPQNVTADTLDQAVTYHMPAVYLGYWYAHHGHFIFETLARWWVLTRDVPPQMGRAKVVMHAFGGLNIGRKADNGMPASVMLRSRRWLDVASIFPGLSAPIIVERRPLLFRQLMLPSELSLLEVDVSPSQRSVYAHIADAAVGVTEAVNALPRRARCVYVSRRRQGDGDTGLRLISNERSVERLFEQRGHEVLHLNGLGVLDQAAIFAHARCVVGFEGSGLHNAVFMQKPEESLVVELAAFRTLSTGQASLMRAINAEYRVVIIPADRKTKRVDVEQLHRRVLALRLHASKACSACELPQDRILEYERSSVQ